MSLSLTSSGAQHAAVQEKQPKALYYLFFAELWERFSFYGMRALLVLYMTKELAFNNHSSYGVFGAYIALMYGSNVMGGYLADTLLGNRRAILIGSIFIILGHLTLALPLGEISFYYGLAFLVVGTGFFKPNVSSFLGQFYHKNDPRRDAGFTIFYMGINVGGLLAPLLCGTVGEVYGFHFGFGLAAIGMLAGAFVFYGGKKHYHDMGHPPCQDRIDRPRFLGLSLSKLIILGALVFVPVAVAMIENHQYMGGVLTVSGFVICVILTMIALKSSVEERKCIFTLMLMFVFVTLFFAIFEQIHGSLILFTESNIDRQFFGMTMPASWSASINPVFIVLFSPFVSFLWTRLGRYNLEPITPFKFAIGFLLASLGFYLFVMGIHSHEEGYVNIGWFVVGTAFFTLAELFISPVGLSMVTKLAPAKFTGLLMGVFFFAIGLASYLAQKIAQVFGAPEDVNAKADVMAALVGFENIFTFISQFALASAVAVLLVTPLVYGVFKRHG